MVYTDGTHLAADSEHELHRFAMAIGLNHDWYQKHPTHPHYDVFGARRRDAVKAGAIIVRPRELLEKSKKMERE